MKKFGFIMFENLLSLIIVVSLSFSVILSVKFFEVLNDSYEHENFKLNFLDFINYGKFKAATDFEFYTLRFSEKEIVDIFKFPKTIKMTKFNGINNRTLDIQNDGLIARGATFQYLFKNDINKITIAAVTGKIGYENK